MAVAALAALAALAAFGAGMVPPMGKKELARVMVRNQEPNLEIPLIIYHTYPKGATQPKHFTPPSIANPDFEVDLLTWHGLARCLGGALVIRSYHSTKPSHTAN